MNAHALSSSAFLDFSKAHSPHIERYLDELVKEIPQKTYNSLYEAARYSLLAPGKRLRPLLMLATVSSLQGPLEASYIPACCLEMVHTYSLIHDDLPCMDDDDLRRGRPTLHKVYQEGHSILTGNFLLTHAFQLLSGLKGFSHEKKIELITSLSTHAGAEGLLGGQVIDLESENQPVDKKTLEQMVLGKTSSLFSCCLEFGAILSNQGSLQNSMRQLGNALGIIFQITDDLLEIESTEEKIGKSIQSDSNNHKSTFVSILGMQEAKKILESHTLEATELIQQLKYPSTLLSFLNVISKRCS